MESQGCITKFEQAQGKSGLFIFCHQTTIRRKGKCLMNLNHYTESVIYYMYSAENVILNIQMPHRSKSF